MPAWDVEVGGVDYSVSIDRSENGKDVVRVGGRVIARPMGAEESERPIMVGGAPYLVRRTGPGTFDLEYDQAAADAHARTLETARTVLAHGDAPVALSRDSSFTRLPWLAVAAIAVAFAAIMFYALGPNYKKQAMQRVDQVLHEMQDPSGGGETPLAVTLWARNKRVLDQNEMSWASDHFDKWRMEKNLYRRVGEYHMLSTAVVRGEKVPTAIVTFTLEGARYRVRVPKDLPIAWEE